MFQSVRKIDVFRAYCYLVGIKLCQGSLEEIEVNITIRLETRNLISIRHLEHNMQIDRSLASRAIAVNCCNHLVFSILHL